MGENLNARLTPEVAAEVHALDERLTRGEGTAQDSASMLRIVWPYYFAHPEAAPPMPDMAVNPDDYSRTFATISEHFERGTLVSGLPQVSVPALFVHGRASPIPWQRCEETVALIPGARLELVDESGHFPWLDRPGSVEAALARAGLPA
jgi:pimeloyl-ACP methyl ester carboxylesterase